MQVIQFVLIQYSKFSIFPGHDLIQIISDILSGSIFSKASLPNTVATKQVQSNLSCIWAQSDNIQISNHNIQ